MIFIENKKRKLEKIMAQYPGADIIDITSNSDSAYAKLLSPFYPHGNIPVPFSESTFAMSVEGIWQGLKVFESCDIDTSAFQNATMKGLKRTVRRFGNTMGHRKGVNGTKLLNYFDARMLIYLPSYKWVLDNVPKVRALVERIAERAKNHDIVFLDYNTNDDFRDLSSPMSHAGLLKLYIDGKYPEYREDILPLSIEEIKTRIKKKKLKKPNNNKKQETLF